MKVDFTYTKNGKTVSMREAHAQVLQKMKLGTYAAAAITHSENRSMQPELFNAPAPEKIIKAINSDPEKNEKDKSDDDDDEPLISDFVKKLAEENGIDIKTVTGTGNKGRITKHDIDQLIQAKNLASTTGQT